MFFPRNQTRPKSFVDMKRHGPGLHSSINVRQEWKENLLHEFDSTDGKHCNIGKDMHSSTQSLRWIERHGLLRKVHYALWHLFGELKFCKASKGQFVPNKCKKFKRNPENPDRRSRRRS